MADTRKNIIIAVQGKDEAGPALKSVGDRLKELKRIAGSNSVLGDSVSLLKGGGALAGISIAGAAAVSAFENLRDLMREINSGAISTAEAVNRIAGAVPLLGGFYRAGNALGETVAEFALRRSLAKDGISVSGDTAEKQRLENVKGIEAEDEALQKLRKTYIEYVVARRSAVEGNDSIALRDRATVTANRGTDAVHAMLQGLDGIPTAERGNAMKMIAAVELEVAKKYQEDIKAANKLAFEEIVAKGRAAVASAYQSVGGPVNNFITKWQDAARKFDANAEQADRLKSTRQQQRLDMLRLEASMGDERAAKEAKLLEIAIAYDEQIRARKNLLKENIGLTDANRDVLYSEIEKLERLRGRALEQPDETRGDGPVQRAGLNTSRYVAGFSDSGSDRTQMEIAAAVKNTSTLTKEVRDAIKEMANVIRTGGSLVAGSGL